MSASSRALQNTMAADLATAATGAYQSLRAFNDSLLKSSAVRNGVNGESSRLACVAERLANRQPLSVAVLGGSISTGSTFSVRRGEEAKWLFHSKLGRALEAAFKTRVAIHNGALPATGPAFFEHCLEGQLPSGGADLILLEFAVNLDGRPAAFERLLRKLLSIAVEKGRPPPAIVAVNAHQFAFRHRPACLCKTLPQLVDTCAWRLASEQTADAKFLTMIAARYGVPVVSLWSAGLAKPEMLPRMGSFMTDCRHPNGQGHTYLAQLIVASLLRSAERYGKRRCSALRPEALPDPLRPNGWPMPSGRCARAERLLPLVTSKRGFAYTDEGIGKPGLVGQRPGDQLNLCLLERRQCTACSQRMVLWLGFLRSWSHMGVARVSCSGMCRCDTFTIDANNVEFKNSVTAVVRREVNVSSVGAGDCCSLEVRVLEASTSGEHKFKVLSVLLASAKAASALPRDASKVGRPAGTTLNTDAIMELMQRKPSDLPPPYERPHRWTTSTSGWAATSRGKLLSAALGGRRV